MRLRHFWKQTDLKLKWSDNGSEFCNNEFEIDILKSSIRRRVAISYTPQENDACLRSRCISSVVGKKTPFELWKNEKPIVNNLKIVGKEVYVLNKDPKKGN